VIALAVGLSPLFVKSKIILCVCVYSDVFARAKRGRTKSFIIIKYKVRFKCRIFCIAPRKEAKPRIELRAKKGNFYDETMAADNEKEEEIEDEEVRFS